MPNWKSMAFESSTSLPTPSMFASNALPLPSPFAHAHENRPFRIASETARPHPTGQCRYLLLHPATQNQQCSCQSFHHNRSAPGNLCECGHQSCFHVPESNHEKHSSPEAYNAVLEKLNLLAEKNKRLEEMLQTERADRDTAFQRERQLWEREVRILREAFAPIYNGEKEMVRRLVDIEDRLEGNYDEQLRLKVRVDVADEAAMAMEKRVEDLEGIRSKRRRVNRNQHPVQEEPVANGYISPETMRRVSSSIDERSSNSIHTPSSRALSPNGVAPAVAEPEEPRSSGILNLAEVPRPMTLNMATQSITPTLDEPRSSGFLNLDIAERLSQKSGSDRGHVAIHSNARITPPQDGPSPPGYTRSNSDVSRISRTPPEIVSSSNPPLINGVTLPTSASPRKRKHPLDHMALDVLADVTVAHIH